MFVILKPFLSISKQKRDYIIIGYYSHYRVKISGEVLENLLEYEKLKNGFALTENKFTELSAESPFFERLNSLELIDIYEDEAQFSKSRRLSFYSIFTNHPYTLLNKIKNTPILIVGCGGLGCRLAVELAGSGFRHFVLIDNDKLENSNLERMF